MTPKEKAQDLVVQFKLYAHAHWSEISGFNQENLIENAKQCALICVDELIKYEVQINEMLDTKFVVAGLQPPATELYWQAVKTEIQNL